MKIDRVVSEIWPWEFSLLQLKREGCLRIPEYAGVVWSGVVLLATKARKSMVVDSSFASALVRKCTNRVWWTSLHSRRCCYVVAWVYLDLGISGTGQSSHEFPTQLSYSADRALWLAKMASVEFCIPCPQVSIGWHQSCAIDRKILKKPNRKIQVWPFLLADVLAMISTLVMFGVLLRVVTGATPLGSTPGFTRMVSECVLDSCVRAADKNC